MRILRLYVLRELLSPFLLSLLFFSSIFLVGNLFKMADLLINKGVGILDILKILLFLVPSLLSFIVPTSALAAILLVFGGMAQNNEITAMKASGIKVFAVMLPVLLVTFLMSLGLLVVSDQVESEAQFASRRALKELVLKHPMAYLEPGKVIKDFQDFLILAQRIEGNRLHEITIYQPQEGGKATRTILAESGEVIASPDQKTLTIKLYNGSADEPNPDDPNLFYKLDFKTFVLPPVYLGKEDPRHKVEKKTREMRFDELIYKLRYDPKVKDNPARREEYEAALHKKISFAFAPFVFAIIGLPAALISRRGEEVVSFSLAMGVVAVYYCLYILGGAMALQAHWNPIIAMWLPNAFMVGCGIALMKQI